MALIPNILTRRLALSILHDFLLFLCEKLPRKCKNDSVQLFLLTAERNRLENRNQHQESGKKQSQRSSETHNSREFENHDFGNLDAAVNTQMTTKSPEVCADARRGLLIYHIVNMVRSTLLQICLQGGLRPKIGGPPATGFFSRCSLVWGRQLAPTKPGKKSQGF